MIKKIHETTDEIDCIRIIDDPDGETFNVDDRRDITHIEAYEEGGKPWIACYRGDNIWMRVSADRVLIFYKGTTR